MPVDPSIPLSFKPTEFPAFSAENRIRLQSLVEQTQLRQLQIEEQRKQMQQQSAVEGVYRNPAYFKDGMISLEGIRALDMAAPGTGQKALITQQNEAFRQTQFDQAKAALAEHRTKTMNEIRDKAVSMTTPFAEQVKTNPGLVNRKAKENYQNTFDEYRRSGRLVGIPEQEWDNLRNHDFDFYSMQSQALGPEKALKVPEDIKKKEEDIKKKEADIAKDKALADVRVSLADIAKMKVDMERERLNQQEGVDVIPPSSVRLHGDEYLATLPQGERSRVKAIAEGRERLPVQSMQRNRYSQMVQQYDPSFTEQTFQQRAGVIADFTKGPTARNITSINTAIGHTGTLFELANALENHDTRLINSVINRVRTELGHPEVNNYELAQQAVGEELMRTFRGVGASEREAADWQAKFSSSKSPQALRDAAKTAAELLNSRIEAVNDQWRRGMNTSEGYPDLLSKHSAQTLEKIGARGRPPGALSTPTPQRRTAVNPKTGEKVEWDGQAWRPIK